ncbi:calnexin precursor [Iris pallida]|uniref:Calnexin n=1 Tax=Iris pallida TaxID=29817 RepID=A0AAX6I4T3_IRIPA|nr:calnexin precursor [Iris pallida]
MFIYYKYILINDQELFIVEQPNTMIRTFQVCVLCFFSFCHHPIHSENVNLSTKCSYINRNCDQTFLLGSIQTSSLHKIFLDVQF